MEIKKINGKGGTLLKLQLLLIAVFLIIPTAVFAGGAAENSEYSKQYADQARKMVKAVAEKELTAREAIQKMEQFRIRNREELTKQDKVCAEILKDLENGKLDRDQAELKLKDMERDWLRERDRDRDGECDETDLQTRSRTETHNGESNSGAKGDGKGQ